MATQRFNTGYTMTNGVTDGGDMPWGFTIDSGDTDNVLEAGESFTATWGPPGSTTTRTLIFDYASPNGIVATSPDFNFQIYITDDWNVPYYNFAPPNAASSYVVCFLAGTMIATPAGEVAVETLKAGDLVLTATGDAKPVRWLGRMTVHPFFAPPLTSMPIRIQAGALGENRPKRDLLVSPDHALCVDGLLIHASALVNGRTITRETGLSRSFVYYHVELADHSLVLAEGVAAETFVDNVSRRAFDNWEEAPGHEAIPEMDFPRAKSQRQVPRALLRRLDARADRLSAPERQAA